MYTRRVRRTEEHAGLFLMPLFWLLLLLPFTMCGAQPPARAESDNPVAFAAAMNRVFVLRSGAGPAAEFAPCHKRMTDLMRRQRLPVRARDLRAVLTDDELFRIVLLAAIASMGQQWARDGSTDAFLVDERGALVRASIPTAVENDVMLCLVCALLTVIAALHIVPPSAAAAVPQQQQQADAKNNNKKPAFVQQQGQQMRAA